VPSLVIDQGQQLVLEIAKPDDGLLLARVPLQYADFQLARDEAWWRGVRAGTLEADLSLYQLRVKPGQADDKGRCIGLSIEIEGNGKCFERPFPPQSMSAVAQRKVLELVNQKVMKLGETYHYYLQSVPVESAESTEPRVHGAKAKGLFEPPVFESARLAECLAKSQPIIGAAEPPEPWAEPTFEIFVTEQVWDEGRKLAHRGDKNESAALYTGRLFRDTDSPEVFVVWDACLEAKQAVEEEYSVTFTGETWAQARQMLDLRRKRINPRELFCASVHRHPWFPEADSQGRRMCEACAAAKYCGRSTAHPSTADFQWHRTVFTGQPWATLLIWGYNAREQEEFRLYGLENASFKERTIRLLTE
jgi:hypothetical protein